VSARLPVLDRRRCGVLLHPTALAAEHGVLGAAARSFVDWLAAAGCSVWQVLPLGPVGADRSPYWVRSDQAGNAQLIDTREAPDPQLARAQYSDFCAAQAEWLEDYVLYAALSRARDNAPWWLWPAELKDRRPDALSAARRQLSPELEVLRTEQWQFAHQWAALRDYARERGICLFGDLPIYVAPDSVATWVQREQFQLQANGEPAALAGVPPDYFSADGQLWGNPLYNWQQAESDDFAFWRGRFAAQLQRFDLVRIDHFRGLAGYWSVPAGAATARDGRWVGAPGTALLARLRAEHGALPVVAEDLGVITPDVDALRRQFELPGMRVLQFGFDGSPDNPHLAHNYTRDTVAYTGTHDNDTTLGWYRSLDEQAARRVNDYLGCDGAHMPAALLRAAVASVAVLAVAPLQDLLELGSDARFNTPGTVGGNWAWRFEPAVLAGSSGAALAMRLRAMNERYGRLVRYSPKS
jgi:4-alpha-glucanotransferase